MMYCHQILHFIKQNIIEVVHRKEPNSSILFKQLFEEKLETKWDRTDILSAILKSEQSDIKEGFK